MIVSCKVIKGKAPFEFFCNTFKKARIMFTYENKIKQTASEHERGGRTSPPNTRPIFRTLLNATAHRETVNDKNVYREHQDSRRDSHDDRDSRRDSRKDRDSRRDSHDNRDSRRDTHDDQDSRRDSRKARDSRRDSRSEQNPK